MVDLVTEGAKPRLVADIGAQYHVGPVRDLQAEPDIVIECTGVGKVSVDEHFRRAREELSLSPAFLRASASRR